MAYSLTRATFSSASFLVSIVALGGALLVTPVAIAQEATDDCRVVPEENAPSAVPDDKTVVDPNEPNTIADCNGMLKPPVVGDPQMVQPAPEVGQTPVLKPKEVPAQPQSE